MEDNRAVFVQMLIEPKARSCAGDHVYQLRLAHGQRRGQLVRAQKRRKSAG
jgi:hypothetical protein